MNIVDNNTGRPTEGGINDLRMGTVDKQLECQTCGCKFEHCPGHFGHIELARPVYHVGFVETCLKILRCVCYNCSALLLKPGDKNNKYNTIKKIKNPKKRQDMLYNASKTIKYCGTRTKDKDDNSTYLSQSDSYSLCVNGCGYEQPIYKKFNNDPLKISIEFKETNNADGNVDKGDKSRILSLSPQQCLDIFQKITDEDCYMLGFDPTKARPAWMIIKNLAVCPPQVRPSVSVDASLRCEDDLTFQYCQILKINHEIKQQEKSGAPEHATADSFARLQFYVATLMNNEISSGIAQQRSGRPIKALSTRLKGKEGRLRGNLMGKRVDFSARSVISPDPNLLLDELGVPMSVALNLTFPETVTPMNIDYLKTLVENGPSKWPGAKYILRDDGVRIDLRIPKNRTDIHLACGYIVERHMRNGDFVVFNRQPSLHKMSMMGHRVRVLPYSTFRLNLSVTSPYNADFDGDEMNMHLPQSYETKAEIVNIMHVPKQIVSPQSNKPVMGIVQDTLIGVKLFTHRDNFITYDEIMNLVMWITGFDGNLPVPAILKPQPLWTGKQIFSLLLPKVNIFRYSSNHDDDKGKNLNLIDSIVQIDNGELLQGIVCRATVGSTSGGLIHCIWNECGPDKTVWFLSNCQRLVDNWMLLSGFTVGISDIISDNQTNRKITETMDAVKKKVQSFLVNAHDGVLKTQPGKGMIESFESQVNSELNQAREVAGKHVQDSLKNTNHLNNMVLAGSKGNITNISQIIACVGQQNVEGKRIPFYFNRRTLPHFIKDDYGPESRGFVENSFLSGLTPQEFFFHAVGGREGIIDTAVKTSETGYIQRRLVKALEDVMVKYDGTVRNSLGNLVQFLYGEDGMTGEFIEDQRIETLNMDNETLCNEFKFFEDDDLTPDLLEKTMQAYMTENDVYNFVYSDDFPTFRLELNNEFNEIVKDRDKLRNHIFKNGQDKQHFPVNILRIISNAQKNFRINIHSLSNLHPIYVQSKKKDLIKKLILVKGEDEFSKEAQSNALQLFTIVLNYNLSCKRIIQKYRLTKDALEWVIGEIETRFYQAIVKPGEMVGNIAAQSIGEPATQMTLNTFHFAGVSSKNVTLGVPRLKEVINVAKRLKTPSMTIYLQPLSSPISQDVYDDEMIHMSEERMKELAEEREKERVKKFISKVEYTTMMDITIMSEIYYDPDLFKTIIPSDQSIIDVHMKIYSDKYKEKLSDYSPWLLRLKLDPELLMKKQLDVDTIENAIKARFDNLDIICSNDNDDEIIIRIRLVYNPNKGIKREDMHSESSIKGVEKILLKEVHLAGITDIKKVYVQFVKKIKYDERTGKLDHNVEEPEIQTDGTNMSEVFKLQDVDFKRVSSNDINEIFEVLGIEAVRKSLIKEVRSVLSPYSIYVNYRHICILCDVMTQRGSLTSITRHGLNRADASPIRKCSFEETVEILLSAGLYCEKDYLRGITENILVGQLAPLGTACFDLLLDIDQIENAKIPEESKDIMEIEDDFLNTPPDKNPLSPPAVTPFVGGTPIHYNKYDYNRSTPTSTMNESLGSFTPGPHYPGMSIPSPGKMGYGSYRADNSYITTPNPIHSIRNPVSPGGYPQSDYYKTPISYSPDAYSPFQKGDDKTGTEYRINTSSPISKSPYVPSSYYNAGQNRQSYIETMSPKSGYSPTTPAIIPRSSSPYLTGSGIYSSTPQAQDSGCASGRYVPHSPGYNPMSPSYHIQSTYSRNSPYYPSGNSGGNGGEQSNPLRSPIQSDDEGENDN